MFAVSFLIVCLAFLIICFFASIYACQRTKDDSFGCLAIMLLIVSLVVAEKLYDKLDALDKEDKCLIKK